MIDGIRFKVCGLTSLVDAEFADRCGADYLGFNLYPKSPRYMPLEQFRAMAPRLPEGKKVAVTVEPTVDELTSMRDAGFDFFQIHFGADTTDAELTAWSRVVGEKHLWLAPRLPPGESVSAAALAVAKFIVFDTFHAGGFGGSGKTGDWAGFVRHQNAHTKNTWILAGGLSPENIGDALRQTGARVVDVNSGVEAAPGIKDEAKLKRFVVAMHQAATAHGEPRGGAV
jgi:phosphoribosylanthranilate isomerase